jgi:hypothetical protein
MLEESVDATALKSELVSPVNRTKRTTPNKPHIRSTFPPYKNKNKISITHEYIQQTKPKPNPYPTHPHQQTPLPGKNIPFPRPTNSQKKLYNWT